MSFKIEIKNDDENQNVFMIKNELEAVPEFNLENSPEISNSVLLFTPTDCSASTSEEKNAKVISSGSSDYIELLDLYQVNS